VGWDWVHLVRRPQIGLLYQPRMIDDDDCGAIGRMRIGRGNRRTRRKSAPVPFVQHKAHMTWARTRAAAVGSLSYGTARSDTKKFPTFIEHGGSLQCSQQPTSSPYLRHLNPVPILTPYFFKINFSIILPIYVYVSHVVIFFSDLLAFLMCSVRATCPTYLILISSP
jgi:hypothetical protein